MLRSRLVAVVVGLAALTTGHELVAQPVGADADAVADAALKLFEQGRWPEAAARFAEADGIVHSPRFTLYRARCARNQGALLAARELFARAARDEVAPDAPDAMRAVWLESKQEAVTELAALERLIPRLTVRLVCVPACAGARVTLDGRPFDVATAPAALDPRTYELRATATDGREAVVSVTLTAGQTTHETEIVLRATPTSESVAPGADAGAEGWQLPAGLLLGFGAAGLLTGTALGGVAWQRLHDIEAEQCASSSTCPPSARPDIEAVDRLATGSNVAFALGGALSVAGIAFAAFQPDLSGDTPADVALSASLGTLLVRGRF